jgi:hypothetical protein
MRIRLALLAVAAAFALATSPGCGGGGGGGGGKGGGGAKSFIVRSIDPRSGAVSLANDAAVTIFLSVEVDPGSISRESFVVAPSDDPENPHPGLHTVSEDRLRVTFTPAPWFQTDTSYVVRVTQDVRSLTGEPLLREFSASFRTGPWPSPDPIRQPQFRVLSTTMSASRSSHTQTTLDSGLVLLAGGWASATTVNSTAELYDPVREDFLTTAGPMRAARGSHTATLLENGLVLIVGGEYGVGLEGQSAAELFSPGSLRFVGTTSMSVERTSHTATLLGDGRVLVIGGRTKDAQGRTVWHSSAEIYDPTAETWTRTGNDMEMVRAGHRATLLDDGRVLVTGGSGTAVAEIYDPTGDEFRTLNARMVGTRSLHGAVKLADGIVFLTDGGETLGELFDPATETFSATSNESHATRYAAVTLLFRPGEVLVVHGIDFDIGFLHGTMEHYDVSYDTLLGDGSFLITGGLGPTIQSPDLNTAVVFDPDPD